MQYRRSQAFITELETSARTLSKRMANHNTPQLSRMDLANHCAAFPGLSRLSTRAVRHSATAWNTSEESLVNASIRLRGQERLGGGVGWGRAGEGCRGNWQAERLGMER
jgi:hypothetical protein